MANGFSVRIASRNSAGGFATSIEDDNSVRRAVDGAWAVVNLVAVLGGAKLHAINVDGSERAARMAHLSGAARFVQISAIGADPHSPSAYGRSKARGEQAVLAHRPDAVILRPSIIFGQGDHFFTRFVGMARLAPIMPVYAGDTRFQPVHVDDVGRAVAVTLTRDDLAGRSFELGGPEIRTMRELMAWVMELAGRKVRLLDVPDRIAMIQAAVMERLPGQMLTRDQMKMLSIDNVVHAGAASFDALGLVPAKMTELVPVLFSRKS